jgi:hypothetical protein
MGRKAMTKTDATVGDVLAKMRGTPPELVALDAVKPNTWNPNTLTPFERESLKQGLRTDGWLYSHALLIWRTDDKGEVRNVIIDGEHRWLVARELGFVEGPMVYLDGITEYEAKKLTIKVDAKRGHFDDELLTKLLKEIQPNHDVATIAIDLGIADATLAKLLSPEPPKQGKGPKTAGLPSGMSDKVVQLYFAEANHEVFTKLVRELAEKFGTEDMSATVLEALKRLAK